MLEIKNLNVSFNTLKGEIAVVREFNLTINRGEVLSIVGESGSGKTVSMLAMMNLLSSSAIFSADLLSYDGVDLLKLSAKKRRKFIGSKIGMIFQDPIMSLNPCYRVGEQLAELFHVHTNMNNKEINQRSLELIKIVGIPEAEQRINCYPHQLSGGMNQRVMIALAIALNPQLLIADEPTTALDVTIQAQILKLIKDIGVKHNMALILITHDMGVVAHLADRVITMNNGWQVEQSSKEEYFTNPKHPYSVDLISSLPEETIGNRLKTITTYNDVQTDGINGCIYYCKCQYSSKSCLTKIENRAILADHSIRCIRDINFKQ